MPRPRAAEARPVLGPGATRDQIIDTYGWPSGQSKLGEKEILTYPQGRVTLSSGRVERVEFKTNVPWPAPRPRPSAPTAVASKQAVAPAEMWLTRFDEALSEAARRKGNLIALFTGADWPGGNKQFQDEVVLHPDFARVFGSTYVFFLADLAARVPTTAVEREKHQALRERYGVTVYPTLLVLSAEGEKLAKINLSKPQPGDSYRARVIAAVREAHDLLGFAPLPEGPVVNAGAGGEASGRNAPPSAAAGLLSAGGLALNALGVGVAVAVVLLWLVWRDWMKPAPPGRPGGVSARIDDAASGLPTYEQILEWPKETVRAVAARLAEGDGFEVELQSDDRDGDLILKCPGGTKTVGFVCCAGGSAGTITVKPVRELFGMLTVEGLPTGWYVAPSGFAAEARAYAAKHKLTLIDAHLLLGRLRDLGPLALTRVLGSTSAPWVLGGAKRKSAA